MSDITSVAIKCNYKPRQIKYGYEMPERFKSDFDYIEPEEFDLHNFVEYKGQWHDLNEFIRLENGFNGNKYWHGSVALSAFNGVLIHICEDTDYVVMAYTHW